MNEYDILEVESAQIPDELPKNRERIPFWTFLNY